MPKFATLIVALSCAVVPVWAAEPAPSKVQGTLQLNGKPIAVTHVYAHQTDNAEGFAEAPELRIALVDRALPAGSLAGVGFPPVWGLAMQGEVRGVMLSMTPGKPDTVRAIWFSGEPGESPASVSGGDKWKKVSMSAERVSGEVERQDTKPSGGFDRPWAVYALSFDTPIVHDAAVTADLKGKAAAQGSPQIKVLRQLAAAMKAGDMAAVKQLTTARSFGQREAQRRAASISDADFKRGMQKMGAQMTAEIGKFDRVIVRSDRAAAVLKEKDGALVLELAQVDGQWKAD